MTQDTLILQLNRHAMIYIYVYNHMYVYTYGYVFITWPAIHACASKYNADWCRHTHIHDPNEQINSTNKLGKSSAHAPNYFEHNMHVCVCILLV